jgi:hypothetical protein
VHTIPSRYHGVRNTTTMRFWPFVGLHPASWLKVTASVVGSCWTSSIATNSERAWRCTSRNEIYDPCLAASSEPGSILVCDPDPVSKSAVLLRLTAALPKNPFGRSPGSTWFLTLANGAKCSPTTGASGSVQSIPMAWGCRNRQGKGAVGDLVGVNQGVVVFAYSSDWKTVESVPVVTQWITGA